MTHFITKEPLFFLLAHKELLENILRQAIVSPEKLTNTSLEDLFGCPIDPFDVPFFVVENLKQTKHLLIPHLN